MPVDAGRIQTMAEQLIRENPKRRILDFTLEGQKYWIKRKLGNGRNQLVKYSVEKEFYYEIARMTIAGRFHPELVPHMVCLTPDYMVTLDGGPTLKNVLGTKREEAEKEGILEDTGGAPSVENARQFLKHHSIIGSLVHLLSPFQMKDIESVRKIYDYLK